MLLYKTIIDNCLKKVFLYQSAINAGSQISQITSHEFILNYSLIFMITLLSLFYPP